MSIIKPVDNAILPQNPKSFCLKIVSEKKMLRFHQVYINDTTFLNKIAMWPLDGGFTKQYYVDLNGVRYTFESEEMNSPIGDKFIQLNLPIHDIIGESNYLISTSSLYQDTNIRDYLQEVEFVNLQDPIFNFIQNSEYKIYTFSPQHTKKFIRHATKAYFICYENYDNYLATIFFLG